MKKQITFHFQAGTQPYCITKVSSKCIHNITLQAHYHSASGVRTYICMVEMHRALHILPAPNILHSRTLLQHTSFTLASDGALVSQVADMLSSCGGLSLMSNKRMVTL